jgi:hypothetical protein
MGVFDTNEDNCSLETHLAPPGARGLSKIEGRGPLVY